jgi:hypothetical protein
MLATFLDTADACRRCRRRSMPGRRWPAEPAALAQNEEALGFGIASTLAT